MLVDVFQNMNGQFCFKNVDVIVGDGQVFKKCYLAIDEKKISYIDDKPPLWLQNNPQNIVDGNGYLVIPGLINAHTHAAMGFFRDLGHQRQSMIESFLFPAEKSLYPELIEPLTWSFIYGSLLSGVTCIVDHYYFSKGVGTALEKIGMRGVLGETVADIGGAFPGEDSLNRALEDLESWNFSERIKPAIAPHAADTVSDKLLKKLSKIAKKENLPIHMHLSQTLGERKRVKKKYALSPVELAAKCGLLGPNTLAVHLVSADDNDIELLHQTGTGIGYCPSSQIIYESLSPIGKFLAKNLKISLGTDCPASNDSADLLTEAKFSALLNLYQKVEAVHCDPIETIKMMCKNPAETFALDGICGTLEVGKSADMVFLKQDLSMLPMEDLHTNLIFSMNISHVRHVMVEGQWILYDRNPVNISYLDMIESYEEAIKEIKKRAFPHNIE